MQSARAIVVFITLAAIGSAEPVGPVDGHFSAWDDVPEIINSITGDDYRQQLAQLHQLTRIKLGYPQAGLCLNDDEHRQYMLQTKRNWSQWWEATGKTVSERKKQGARIDGEAFGLAWRFLGTGQEPPDPIQPVWIPGTWTLYVTFSNGDYMGREKELWVMDRKVESASLTRLRGDYSQGGWSVTMSEAGGLTPQRADSLLRAMCYLHRYAPDASVEVPGNGMTGLYYPHSTLHLRVADGVLWNTEGYDFTKTRPEFGDGESGRSFYFLTSHFPKDKAWKPVVNPASDQLAPYRTFLSSSKPYFSASVSDVIQFFGHHGGDLEKQAMLEWAEKEMAATNPNMDWTVCSGDFGTELKVNVINSTRTSIQATLRFVKMAGDRLEVEQGNGGVVAFDADRAKERELEQYVSNMLAVEKQEKEDDIQRHPQPLRDLIIASNHPDDSDLKHLSDAVQSVRDDPDPKLFPQLVREMHERSLMIRTLLNQILLNEHDLLDLKPWGDREEAIAVGSCIDSLPLAQDDATDDLIESLLLVCGGGRVEIDDENGGRSIEVIKTARGHRMILGSASNPLSLEDVQKDLRRIYANSKAE